MLETACIWNKNSFPALLAGSPVQLSSVPNTPNETSALFNNLTNDLVIFFALSSKEPAQPTQKRISGSIPFSFNSFRVGIFILVFKDLDCYILFN